MSKAKGKPGNGNTVKGTASSKSRSKGAKPRKSSGGSLQEQLESALMMDTNDLGAHAAYADLLSERGDPRGEFIQVQLALEDKKIPPAQRKEQVKREQALLKQHGNFWMGKLADFLEVGEHEGQIAELTFARGWIDTLRIARPREDLTRAMAGSPEIRLLRQLIIEPPSLDEPPDMFLGQPLDRMAFDRTESFQQEMIAGPIVMYYPHEEVAINPLLKCKHLGNVRILRIGDPNVGESEVNHEPIPKILALMPKLENLCLVLHNLDTEQIFAMKFPQLRRLHIVGVCDYALPNLAKNPSLKNLTHLLIEPAAPGGHKKLWVDDAATVLHSTQFPALKHLQIRFVGLGDIFCEEIVKSGILGRLESLDVQFCQITDAGAGTLAGSKDLRRLKRLDIVNNYLTKAGIKRLKSAGIELVHNPQTSPPEEEAGEDGEEIILG